LSEFVFLCAPRTRTQAFRRRRHWMTVHQRLTGQTAPTHRSDVFRVYWLRYFWVVKNKIPKNIYQIFNPTNLLNHMVPSIELMMQLW